MRLFTQTLTLFLCLFLSNLAGQSRNDRRISVPATANSFLRAEGYRLDHGSTTRVSFVYADRKLIRKLEAKGISFQYKPERRVPVRMVTRADWNFQKNSDCSVPLAGYPTYDLYEQLMNDFAAAYPNITRLHNLGTLSSGRNIWALEITDHPDREEEEPKVLYTSSMHGDELGGYHVTLRLISHLLCNYGSDADLTNLINNTELWINPLANPNGAYNGGNQTVNGAIRWNSNGIDLNRNYPDPAAGEHPDDEPYQPETHIFMELAENVSFDLGLNFHGGAEVFNYPWDTYSERHADDDWWRHVAREFADGCQNAAGNNGFFNDLEDGITNGYDWYPVAGGRQDYMCYDHRAREATLEISDIKLVPESDFETLWQNTRDPLVDFIRQANYGLSGTVTDSVSGEPIKASITIPGHDLRNSDVFSKLPTGRYHRYLKAGTYSLVYNADGYLPKVVTYDIVDQQSNHLHVQLVPETFTSVYNSSLNRANIMAYYKAGQLQLSNLPVLGNEKWHLTVFASDGKLIWTDQRHQQQDRFGLDIGNLPAGMYFCRVQGDGGQKTVKFQVARRKRR